jgi:hypothetical protein
LKPAPPSTARLPSTLASPPWPASPMPAPLELALLPLALELALLPLALELALPLALELLPLPLPVELPLLALELLPLPELAPPALPPLLLAEPESGAPSEWVPPHIARVSNARDRAATTTRGGILLLTSGDNPRAHRAHEVRGSCGRLPRSACQSP